MQRKNDYLHACGVVVHHGALALTFLVTLMACGLASAAQSTTASSATSTGQTATTGSSSGGGTSNGKPILWTHLAANDDRVLLYQRSSHTAKIAQINGSGALAVMKTYAGNMDDWTHITGTGKDFFFYNRDTHAAAVAQVGNDGSLIYVKKYAADSLGDWTDITGADGSLMFYNRDSCAGDYVGLASDGTFFVQLGFDRIRIGCSTTLASSKRGDNVFYRSDIGVAYFANPGGSAEIPTLNVHEVDGFGAWTNIVGAANLLFFYNRANHQPYVGQWNSASTTFTNIHAYKAGDAPDFNLLAATSDHIVYFNSDPGVHAGGVWKLSSDGMLTNATRF
jgi:hypothetical protein